MTNQAIRRGVAAFLLALALCTRVSAQVEDEFEEEYDDELPYVGLGVGFTPTMIFMNLDELNGLAESFQVGTFSGPLILYGGDLAFTPIFIRNVRVGFFALGGFSRLSRDRQLRDTAYSRTLRFGVRFMGGLHFDYAFQIARTFTILPSVSLGWGSYSLELVQSRAQGENFGSVFDPVRFGNSDTTDFNRSARILNGHGFIYPTVHFEYAPSASVMVRLSTGYHLGVLGSTWTDEGGTEVFQVPEIDADGPTLQIGLFFGLFQQ